MPIRRHLAEIVDPGEPEEIRQLTKGQLFDQLSSRLYLPEKNSKGVNRRYLVGVYTNEFFNVETLVIKRFELDLTPGQLKKAPYVNLCDLYTKLSQVLTEMRRSPLGFAPGIVPEEKWLLRVTRYIDQQNITGTFFEAIPNAPAQETDSQRMITAKMNAERYLLGANDLLANPRVFAEIKAIWETQKKLTGRQKELEVHTQICQSLQAKITQDHLDLQSNVMKASMTVFAVGNQLNDADRVFHEENGNAYRVQVNEITSL